MQKNVASQKLIVFAFDATTNLPKTGDAANITAYVSKDFGSVTVLGDTSATEMDATNAKGYYLFDLTQAETNADALLFSAKSATANIVVLGAPAYIQTIPAAFALVGGAAGGPMIAGSNAATTYATLTVTGATTLTGNVLLSDGMTIAAPSTGNRAGITVTGNGTGAGVSFTSGNGASGDAMLLTAASTNGRGIRSIGNGSGAGISSSGGSGSGHGLQLIGGGSGSGMDISSGATGAALGITSLALDAVQIVAAGGNSHGIYVQGAGSKHGVQLGGGATGHGLAILGGGTSGNGINVTTTSGDGISVTATGTSKHGAVITGGTAGTSDGMKLVAGSGGVDLRAAITGSITGSLSGSVASVTGAVGSVTGLTAANLDATISSRLATASYTAPPSVATILTTAITEAYRANGAAPTLAQFMSEVLGHLGESVIAGTTKTVNKFDHATPAETFTLDSATTPSAITRAT